MDPISQGSLGAVLPGSLWDWKGYRAALLLGFVAGMVPDLDILIQSDTDPLLYLEYHRQFTHSLVFIPFGALIVAAIGFVFVKRWLSFTHAYLACLLGYATHGLLDACTSYGTQLFWPFTDFRVSWNVVSIIDPLFTIPLLVCVILSFIRKSRIPALVGLTWVVVYLGIGGLQYHRALHEGEQIAREHGHSPQMLTAKPAFANLLAWKVIYLEENTFHVEAVRVAWDVQRCGNATAPKFDMSIHTPWLQPDSIQAIDIARFSWFSEDYIAPDPVHANHVIDIRYSFLPNQIDALWGIVLDKNAGEKEHARFETYRETTNEQYRDYLAIVNGRACT